MICHIFVFSVTTSHPAAYTVAILVAILSAEGVSGLTIDDEALANKTTTKSPSTTTNETAPTTTGTTASPPTTVADSTELETTGNVEKAYCTLMLGWCGWWVGDGSGATSCSEKWGGGKLVTDRWTLLQGGTGHGVLGIIGECD